VHIAEIGVFSGGSLLMWQEYFGPNCHVYGIDLDPACKAYEAGNVRIFIGDQGSPAFWRQFLAEVPQIDILVDDGGHLPEQQIASLEALLPALSPGGVYVCEDIHGKFNGFQAYVSGLTQHLNHLDTRHRNPNAFQQAVHSIHHYPFVTVLERHERTPLPFEDPRHGTQWLPQIAGENFDPKTFSG
jgi:Methyltransferase domain